MLLIYQFNGRQEAFLLAAALSIEVNDLLPPDRPNEEIVRKNFSYYRITILRTIYYHPGDH